MDWGVIVAAVSLEVVILTSAVGIVWRLTRTEVSLRAEWAKEVAIIKADAVREISALQSKVYQFEIWARDEFVRRGSFDIVVARLEKSLELMGTKVETAIDKMSTKIDSLNHHHGE